MNKQSKCSFCKKPSIQIASLVIAIFATLLLTRYFFAPQQQLTQQIQSITDLVSFPEQIKGTIVTLKKLKLEFIPAFHEVFSDDVRKNLEFPERINLAYTKKYVTWLVTRMNQGLTIMYAIFDNQEDKLIGAIQIREPNPTDPGQLGMWLNEHYRGNGRIQEALKLISHIYFHVKQSAQKFNAHVALWNTPSYKALIKAGFHEVGCLYEDEKATRYLLELYRSDVESWNNKP